MGRRSAPPTPPPPPRICLGPPRPAAPRRRVLVAPTDSESLNQSRSPPLLDAAGATCGVRGSARGGRSAARGGRNSQRFLEPGRARGGVKRGVRGVGCVAPSRRRVQLKQAVQQLSTEAGSGGLSPWAREAEPAATASPASGRAGFGSCTRAVSGRHRHPGRPRPDPSPRTRSGHVEGGAGAAPRRRRQGRWGSLAGACKQSPFRLCCEGSLELCL